jgi:hypothetical protein
LEQIKIKKENSLRMAVRENYRFLSPSLVIIDFSALLNASEGVSGGVKHRNFIVCLCLARHY